MNNQFALLPNYLFVIDVSVSESLKRRYAMGDKPILTNQEFLDFYKKEMDNFHNHITCAMWYLDTSNLTIDEVKVTALNKIMEILA